MKETLLITLLVILSTTFAHAQENSPEIPEPFDLKVVKTAEKESKDSMKEKDDVTYEKFQRVELEMDYYTVMEIIGSEGNVTSESKSGDYESKSYVWRGDKFARIDVRFQNDKLVSKSQSNLTERKGIADLTQEKFDKVDTGMSYYEVLAILGSDGEMTRISKFGKSVSTSYTWKGPNYQRVITSFKDGKLTNKTQLGLK